MTMLGPRQAAHVLGVSTRTLEEWRARGKGPAYHRMEGQIRYAQSDLDAWLKSCRVEAHQGRLPFQTLVERVRARRGRKASAICGRSTLREMPLFAIKAG